MSGLLYHTAHKQTRQGLSPMHTEYIPILHLPLLPPWVPTMEEGEQATLPFSLSLQEMQGHLVSKLSSEGTGTGGASTVTSNRSTWPPAIEISPGGCQSLGPRGSVSLYAPMAPSRWVLGVRKTPVVPAQHLEEKVHGLGEELPGASAQPVAGYAALFVSQQH